MTSIVFYEENMVKLQAQLEGKIVIYLVIICFLYYNKNQAQFAKMKQDTLLSFQNQSSSNVFPLSPPHQEISHPTNNSPPKEESPFLLSSSSENFDLTGITFLHLSGEDSTFVNSNIQQKQVNSSLFQHTPLLKKREDITT